MLLQTDIQTVIIILLYRRKAQIFTEFSLAGALNVNIVFPVSVWSL